MGRDRESQILCSPNHCLVVPSVLVVPAVVNIVVMIMHQMEMQVMQKALEEVVSAVEDLDHNGDGGRP